MKKIIIIAFFILGVGTVLFFGSQNNTDQAMNDNSIKNQEVTKYSEEIKKANGQLIDVREPSEYEGSHADSAINIPLGDLQKGDFSKVKSDSPIYVYCRTGRRSALAKTALEKAGYKNIIDIGGLTNWENQGDKVCSSSVPSCS